MSACKKDKTEANNVANLNVFNGIIQKNVQLKINGNINNSGANSGNSRQNTIFFGSNTFYYAEAKNTPISILDRTDSSNLLSQNYDLKKGGIYTLLLAGIAPNVETALIDDSGIPMINLSKTPLDVDSVIHVRFINLVPDVSNINVRIQGTTNNEVTGLAYKGASPWRAYPAKSTNANPVFEFVKNDTVLRTQPVFIHAISRFKNVALVLRGMKTPGAGQPGLVVSLMNYYQ